MASLQVGAWGHRHRDQDERRPKRPKFEVAVVFVGLWKFEVNGLWKFEVIITFFSPCASTYWCQHSPPSGYAPGASNNLQYCHTEAKSSHCTHSSHVFTNSKKICLLIKVELAFNSHFIIYFNLFSWSNTQFYESRIFCLFTFWVLFQIKV